MDIQPLLPDASPALAGSAVPAGGAGLLVRPSADVGLAKQRRRQRRPAAAGRGEGCSCGLGLSNDLPACMALGKSARINATRQLGDDGAGLKAGDRHRLRTSRQPVGRTYRRAGGFSHGGSALRLARFPARPRRRPAQGLQATHPQRSSSRPPPAAPAAAAGGRGCRRLARGGRQRAQRGHLGVPLWHRSVWAPAAGVVASGGGASQPAPRPRGCRAAPSACALSSALLLQWVT